MSAVTKTFLGLSLSSLVGKYSNYWQEVKQEIINL
jgi:hypothetical protein